jgi:hypothetical protein
MMDEQRLLTLLRTSRAIAHCEYQTIISVIGGKLILK